MSQNNSKKESFMSMYKGIVWGDPQNERVCLADSTLVAEYAKFSLGHWSFLGPRSETKCNATDTFRPGGEWDRVAELMMINLSESLHPTFRATNALERGTLKSKGDGMLSINFCGDYVNVELIFRTFVPVDQLSINGAVADLCEEFTLPLANTRKPCLAMDKSESLVLFAYLLNIQSPLLTNEQAQGNLLQHHKESVENLPDDEQLIKLCTDVGFIKTVAPRQCFLTKDAEEFSQFDGHLACPEKTLPREDESSKLKGWMRGDAKIGPALEVVTNYHQRKARS